jgi:tetratricopeptide (TPR) repeat protein
LNFHISAFAPLTSEDWHVLCHELYVVSSSESTCIDNLPQALQAVAKWLHDSNNTFNSIGGMKHSLKKNCITMIAVLGVVQILTMAMPGGCEAESELLRLRRGVVQTFPVPTTRLVLDVSGQRPTSIDSTSPDKLVISFQELRSKLNPEIVLSDPGSSVSLIKILPAGKGSQILVQLRSANSVISHSFVTSESQKSSLYQMLVEIKPPAKQKVAEGAGKDSVIGATPVEKGLEPTRVESSTVSQKVGDGSGKESKTDPSPVDKSKESARSQSTPVKQEAEAPKYKEVDEANLSEPLKEANRLLAEGKYEQAFSEFNRLLNTSALGEVELPVALYGLADSYFFMHQKELPNVAQQVTNNYLSALQAEPLTTQAAWAYYRLGLTHQASEDHQQAIAIFQKAIQDYPRHPVLPLCWLGLGVSYQKTESHLQAIRALRTALEFPLDPSQKSPAYWLLGSSLYATGEYAPAIKAFEQCLTEAPSWYLEQPVILKYLGECYFNQKQYGKSLDYLLWYLNLKTGKEEKDLILVKIAEILSVQDKQVQANNLYDHIRNQYPDSEGDVIAQIRNSDFLESKGRISRDDDLNLFRELAKKPLPAELSKLVYLKLASREYKYGNFEESLDIIDHIQQDKASRLANNDVQSLRSKVILDWSKHAFQNHDYGRVIELYEGSPNTFAEVKTQEFYIMIAESYARIKQHKKAISVYHKILANKGATPEEDTLVRIAECCFLAEDFESAIQICDQIKRTQFQPKKMQLLAQIYFTQRQYSKVVQCLNSLPETDIAATNNPNLSSIYGESLFQLEEYEKAIPWLQKAFEQKQKAGSHPDELLPFYITQATCYSKLKKYDKAIAVLENAVAIASSENLKDQLNYDISKYYLEWGQKDKAVQKLTKLKNSKQSFWQTAAKQQLDYIEVQGK